MSSAASSDSGEMPVVPTLVSETFLIPFEPLLLKEIRQMGDPSAALPSKGANGREWARLVCFRVML